MTALEMFTRLGIRSRACAPGLAFLRKNSGRPARDVLDFALSTTEGCSYVRWFAVQVYGQRAVEAIHRGHCRALKMREPVEPVEWRYETTHEVAGWLMDEITLWGGAEPPNAVAIAQTLAIAEGRE